MKYLEKPTDGYPSALANMTPPNPSITLACATIEDVPTILHLIQKLSEYEKLSHQVTATEELLRDNLFGPQPKAEAILAKLDATAVGFALFFPTFSTFLGKPGLWLEDIFVLEEHRNCGIGLALFKRVAQIAVERGCGRMEWSVLDWNKPALDFYRKLGASKMDDWRIERLAGDALLQFGKNS